MEERRYLGDRHARPGLPLHHCRRHVHVPRLVDRAHPQPVVPILQHGYDQVRSAAEPVADEVGRFPLGEVGRGAFRGRVR